MGLTSKERRVMYLLLFYREQLDTTHSSVRANGASGTERSQKSIYCVSKDAVMWPLSKGGHLLLAGSALLTSVQGSATSIRPKNNQRTASLDFCVETVRENCMSFLPVTEDTKRTAAAASEFPVPKKGREKS